MRKQRWLKRLLVVRKQRWLKTIISCEEAEMVDLFSGVKTGVHVCETHCNERNEK
jgi:hypothetical protein